MTDTAEPATSPLRLTIASGDFFSSSDQAVLYQIREEFGSELERLKRAYSIRNSVPCAPTSQSPSRLLYGDEFDEVNRTLVSVLALRWIYNCDYEKFTRDQPAAAKLDYESFKWIRGIYLQHLHSNEDVYALVMSVVINDLGKDPQLAVDVRSITEHDISTGNHDLVLLEAVKNGLVPCVDRLETAHKEDILKGMELGAQFNFGQLAQAENVPACLVGLRSMRNQPRAFTTRFMEQILDIAGASGHLDWECALKLIQPISDAYHTVFDAGLGVISGSLSLREGYDLVLIRRAKLLSTVGFRVLDPQNKEDRALLRLLCMGGVTSTETASHYEQAFRTLDPAILTALVHSLTLDGSIDEPAVQPTYMPAMLSKGYKNTKSGAPAEIEAALKSLYRYLSRVLTISEQPSESVSVIERDVLPILGRVVDGDGFKRDPGILDYLPVPPDSISMSSSSPPQKMHTEA